jgi:hypothetical protein
MVSMARGRGALVVAAAVAIASGVGCGSESLGGRPPTGTGGSGASTSGAGTGGDLGIDRGAPFCGEMQAFSVSAPFPPDILILMDRSSSLLDDGTGISCTGGCGASSKWALLTAAIDKLVVGVGSVNWGLMFFGTDDPCATNLSPAVPLSASAAASMMIVGALGTTTPGGNAPTTAALSAAAEYLGSLFDPSPKYVLLVTDGQSSGCGSGSVAPDDAAENAVSSLRSLGFPTFVLASVAAGDTAAIAALNQMAVNGGEQQEGGANAFYATTDNLGAALDPTRASLTTSCTIPLAGPLPAGMTLEITAQLRSDGSMVPTIPHDSTNGWDYGPGYTSIVLNGTSCESAQDGSYSQIFVTYRCDYPAGLVQGHGHADGR